MGLLDTFNIARAQYARWSEAKKAGFSEYVHLEIGRRGLWVGYSDQNTSNIYTESRRKCILNGIGTFHNGYDGRQYSGHWENNVLGNPNGYGQRIYHDTDFYEGQLKAGQPHGTGKLFYSGGSREDAQPYSYDVRFLDVYEGQFQNGLPHGQGKLVWRHGVEYEGQFVKGKKHGLFKCVLPEGVVAEINFDQDNFVSYRVTSPADHPLKSNEFRSGVIAKGRNQEDYLYLGSPDGYAIKLEKSGLVGNDHYMGHFKQGLLYGEGCHACFYLDSHFIERGKYRNGLLQGQGETVNIREMRYRDPLPEKCGTALLQIKEKGELRDNRKHGRVLVEEKYLRRFPSGHNSADSVYEADFVEGQIVAGSKTYVQGGKDQKTELGGDQGTYSTRAFPRLDKTFQVVSGSGVLETYFLFGFLRDREFSLRGANVSSKSAILPFRTGTVTVSAQGTPYVCQGLMATKGLVEALNHEIKRLEEEDNAAQPRPGGKMG